MRVDKSFGERIKTAREKTGLSQRQAAEKAGVHHATLSKWERSEAIPVGDGLLRLAGVLGTSGEALLGFDVRFMGLPLRHDWPEGLKEFVASATATELELRPWEVPILAALIRDEGKTHLGTYAAILLNWRVHHADLTGVDPDTITANDLAGNRTDR